MFSLFRTLNNYLASNATLTASNTNAGCKNDFITATDADALFPRTKIEVDGVECMHDCESCTIRLPHKWSIDEHDKLYGQIQGWSRHLLVATGKSDWARDVADEEDSVMQAMGEHVDNIEGGRLMLSATNIPVPDHADYDGPYGKSRPTTVLLLPLFKYIDGVTPDRVPQFIESVINTTPTNLMPPFSLRRSASGPGRVGSDILPSFDGPYRETMDLPIGMRLRDCPHKYLILLCSQGTRDARCGQSAPLLRRELERHLRPLGIYRDLHDQRPGGVGIYFISHVGGHKYSANMMVYRRGEPYLHTGEQSTAATTVFGSGSEAVQCIWLARIRPQDCENVVKYTVLQGKVVRPESQLRGGFDRERGVVSW